MLISNLFKISYIKIWIFALFLNLLKSTNSSSVESCLSAYSINLSNKFDPNSVLPIDCQCSNTDLVCLNLRIYDLNPTDSQLAFPTLNILFTKYNDSINYILPKTRFSFFGYKNLIPNAFRGVKFVDLNNTNICNQSIYIDFLETTYFPGGVFDRFGNLENVTGNNRPKLYLTVRNEEFLAIQNNFTLETNSFAGINIEKLSIKYPLPLNAINSNAFLNSVINTFEIKQATGFTSFTETLDYPRITVKNLIIDECYNFAFNDKSIPTFEGLNSLAIKTSGVKQIPLNIWNNYKYLKSLRITGNQLTNIDQTSFKGLENSLETLDLSNNSITSFDWTAFRNFISLKSFDFSNNLFSVVQSPSRLWPNPNGVEVISLKGYTFDNSSICQFKKESDTQIINLFKTFIELDSSHACNCFVFFIYKDYRALSTTNSLNQNNLMNKTPQCYQRIYAQSQNFIQIAEDSCNFSFACNPQTTTPSSVTTPCYSTISTTPGLTTISKRDCI